MDVLEIKRLYGRNMTFWGGISTQRTLPYGTRDEVRKETRNLVREMRRGGGYIAGPSQAIQADVPPANALALVEVLKELGRRKGNGHAADE
jgi:uroporphyrinogen decarboxylase